MRKELDHFCVGEYYGGDQEWFSDSWMKIGGCAAVTACDLRYLWRTGRLKKGGFVRIV